jgi:hypothetical protein
MVPLAGLTPQRTPLCAAGVKLYASPTGVQSQYTELAILSAATAPTVHPWLVRGLTDMSEQRGLVSKLQEKAAALGANGLIVGAFNEGSTKEATTVQATAIWIPTDSASAFAVCGYRG